MRGFAIFKNKAHHVILMSIQVGEQVLLGHSILENLHLPQDKTHGNMNKCDFFDIMKDLHNSENQYFSNDPCVI